MHRILLSCALALSALTFAAPVAAAECTEITTASNIIGPGAFCLAASITSSATSGAAITISANDVSFDCRGFTLHNTQVTPNTNAYGITFTNRRNITIRNCRITGDWAAGIWAYQDNGLANQNTNLSFTGNTIAGANWVGIQAYGTDIEVRDNRIMDIGGRDSFAMGIRVGASNVNGEGRNFVVVGNTISRVRSPLNNAYGIYANNGEHSVFNDNVINGTATGNIPGGFWAYGIHATVLGDNEARGNSIFGNADSNEIGIKGSAYMACYHNISRTNLPYYLCDGSNQNY